MLKLVPLLVLLLGCASPTLQGSQALPRFGDVTSCRRVWSSDPGTDWCQPKAEIWKCTNGVVASIFREPMPEEGNVCAIRTAVFPPGHPGIPPGLR